MKRILLSALVSLAGGLVMHGTEIVGHRGASFEAPENTVIAEKLAWAQGADAVETDIQLTKDGQIIALHDKTLKRTASRDAKPGELDLAAIQALDAGCWKHAKYAGEPVPTLRQQLEAVPAGKRFLIEIKAGPEIVPPLVALLNEGIVPADRLTVISFKCASLAAFKKAMPAVTVLYLAENDPQSEKSSKERLDTLIAKAKAQGFDGLDLESTWPLNDADAIRVRQAGLQLHVWTVDDVPVALRWVGLGADSITTNRPGWLREQLIAAGISGLDKEGG